MPDPQLPTGGKNSSCRSSNGGRASSHCAAFRVVHCLLNSRLTRRVGAYFVPLIFVWASFSSVLGCGSGTFAFDGGHIPTGGITASAISGTAYAAEAYSMPVAGATVTVTNTSISGDRLTQTTTTTATGSFAFTNGFPDAANVNEYQISVTPPPGSGRVSQQISFPVNAGQSATVLVAMPQSSFNESLAAAVTVLQQNYSVHTGDMVSVGAELLDIDGSPLAVSPTLVFTGNFGVISPGGLFTSTSSGVGTVSAYWYTGKVQLQSNAATITANPTISVKPPAPPPVTSAG